jgi:GT2 family glycosyltransferase
MYGEDTDLCLRAAAVDETCLICPAAGIVHHGAQSDAVRADKVLRLFRAKAQLFEKHWRPGTAGFGLRLLDLYVFSRLVATGVLRRVAPARYAAGHAAWCEVWRRRAEFRPRQASPPGPHRADSRGLHPGASPGGCAPSRC